MQEVVYGVFYQFHLVGVLFRQAEVPGARRLGETPVFF